MQRQLRDQLFDAVLPAHEVQWHGQVGGRTQQVADDQLRHGVRHADRQLQGPARRPAAQGFNQLATDAKDLVGVPMDDAAGLGQRQRAALPLQQPFAQ